MNSIANSPVGSTYRFARKIAITVLGVVILAAGVIMLVLPGPAILVIPAGLALLALEYKFARRWLATVRRTTSRFNRRMRLRTRR